MKIGQPLVLAVLVSVVLSASTFTDGFEGTSINPSNWTVTGPGTATLTNATAHSGSQSVQLAASTGFPWNVALTHDFGSQQSGAVSVYVQTGVVCCGSAADLEIHDGNDNPIAAIQRTSDGSLVGRFWPAGLPEIPATPISGPVGGWHKLEIDANSGGVTMKLDSVTVFTNTSPRMLRFVSLNVWGGPGGSEYYDDFSATIGCQMNACGLGVTDNCVSLSNGRTSMYAQFTPPSGSSLTAAASACGFQSFDWMQTVEFLPSPSPFATVSNPSTPLTAPPAFRDPPDSSGYTYGEDTAGRYPFFYNPTTLSTECAQTDLAGNCILDVIISLGGASHLLNFVDTPWDPCFVGGDWAGTAKCHGSTAPAGSYIRFKTALVGVVGLSPGATPSSPLFEWEWLDSFNGTSAGTIAQLSGNRQPDPGTGTGGITITSINGVPQAPPQVTCTATPNTLWPPNGKSVLVTASGIIIPGTSSLVSGGTAYAVIDEYGQVQPSGNIALGPGGSYSFGVSLIAARNGDDQDGRTYTIVVGAKDMVGNVGSCSAVVTVPHDQGK